MSFYSFRLDKIAVKHRRGLVPDMDVVTFSVLVNQLDRGHGTGIFATSAGTVIVVRESNVPPNNRLISSVRVFISYSHDSREHCDRVALAQQLRRDGINAEPKLSVDFAQNLSRVFPNLRIRII